MSINTAVIMGRLTADPELKTTASGLSVLSFSVAVERNYQKEGEEKAVDFINVVAWRKTAEFVSKYFHKGSMIAVEGSIQTRKYEDKDGNKRTAVEILANTVSFCGKEASVTPAESSTPAESTPFTDTDTADDEGLPF